MSFLNQMKIIHPGILISFLCVIVLNSYPHTAIIVPMRNREAHLQQLKNRYVALANQHGNLIRIVVAEQDDQERYNPGKSRNVGFVEAAKFNPSHVVFNDVDTWLRSDDIWKNMITPPPTNQCKLLCYNAHERINGIFSFLPTDYVKTNGFPNDFIGWGPEDILFYRRTTNSKILIWRYPKSERNQRGGRSCCDEDVNHSRDTSLDRKLRIKLLQWKLNTTGLSDLQYTVTKHTTEQLNDYVICDHIWFK